MDLLKDLMSTGPTNMKRLLDVAEKMPSGETLDKLNSTLNSLIPYIPQLEKILGDGNVANLERLVGRLPDAETLNRLAAALPMLEKLPDKETLLKMLEKADSLEKFLKAIEEVK